MPHAISAIDRRHIRIQCPPENGTLLHNYKVYFSPVLMAVCDASYCFTLMEISDYDSNNDSGILARSIMGRRFEDHKMNPHNPSPLQGYHYDPLFYCLLDNEIFPLKHG